MFPLILGGFSRNQSSQENFFGHDEEFFHGRDGQALQWWSPRPWRYPALRAVLGIAHSSMGGHFQPGILTAPSGGFPSPRASLSLGSDPSTHPQP